MVSIIILHSVDYQRMVSVLPTLRCMYWRLGARHIYSVRVIRSAQIAERSVLPLDRRRIDDQSL